jgi:hypothetical protein
MFWSLSVTTTHPEPIYSLTRPCEAFLPQKCSLNYHSDRNKAPGNGCLYIIASQWPQRKPHGIDVKGIWWYLQKYGEECYNTAHSQIYCIGWNRWNRSYGKEEYGTYDTTGLIYHLKKNDTEALRPPGSDMIRAWIEFNYGKLIGVKILMGVFSKFLPSLVTGSRIL